MITDHTFDTEWFERIRYINARLPDSFKPMDYKPAKDKFIQIPGTQPNFIYTDIDLEEISEAQRVLDLLENDIVSREKNTVVSSLYREKILEKSKQFKIKDLLNEKDLTDTGREEVQKLVESAYGKPKLEIFNGILASLSWKLSKLESVNIDKSLFLELSKICSGFKAEEPPLVRNVTNDSNLDRQIKDVSEIPVLFRQALKEAGLDNWSVVVDEGRTGKITVWPITRKEISLPSLSVLQRRHKQKPFTYRRVAGLVAHEIYGHTVRAQRGSESPLRLLGLGLADYLKGEEGIAMYKEQIVSGADDYAGLEQYLAIGLAYGLDRGVKRNFREVYDLMKSYYRVIWNIELYEAESKSFMLCKNIFMRPNKEGFAPIFTKGISYREGNMEINKLAEAKPQWINWFNVGKFDPNNQGQVKALVELGILPSRLLSG